MSSTKPKIIVFDLDYTLWPFWVDTHVNPPFRLDKMSYFLHVRCAAVYCKKSGSDGRLRMFEFPKGSSEDQRQRSGNVIDALGKKVKYYSEVPEVLESLHKEGYELGIASRTGEIDGANQLLNLFDWNKYFRYKQIYPGCKVTHFNRIKNESGFSYDQMLFFDDEHRNIQDLEGVGVVSILVDKGVTKNVVKEGLRRFAERRK